MGTCSLLLGYVFERYGEYLLEREAQGSIIEDKENVRSRVNTE
jgi:hypothetical protein